MTKAPGSLAGRITTWDPFGRWQRIDGRATSG